MFRNCIKTWRWVAIAMVIGLFCSSRADAVKPEKPPKPEEPTEGYTILPFMPPDSSTVSSAVTDLNEMGQAVGSAEDSDGGHYVVHLDLTTEPIQYTSWLGHAAAVNNFNEIVGSVGSPGEAAFWKEPETDPILLPPLPYVPSSPVPDGEWIGRETYAVDINDGDGTTYRVVDNEGDVTYLEVVRIKP